VELRDTQLNAKEDMQFAIAELRKPLHSAVTPDTTAPAEA
jgi:hypothetical protein